MKAVEAAIENLYSAFSDVMRPAVIEGCSHCIDDKEVEKLLATPLREIEPDDLGPYASSAFLTVGDIPDYLYFLPRILEISVKVSWWWPDIEVTGRAIGDANPDAWRPHHRQALHEFLGVVIRHWIETENFDQVDGWMCGIARMGFDVSPFLKIIGACPEAVCGYYQINKVELDRDKLSNAFWESGNKGHDVIVKWFRSEAVAKICNEF